MIPMKVTTNNVPRDLVSACDLPAEVRSEFDYLDWDAIDAGDEDAHFFQYRGDWWDLGEFTRLDDPVWHGVFPQTYFSGLCVRLVEDEQIVVGSYFEG